LDLKRLNWITEFYEFIKNCFSKNITFKSSIEIIISNIKCQMKKFSDWFLVADISICNNCYPIEIILLET
jgi:hypothetical protein